jgi:hypothetical protein
MDAGRERRGLDGFREEALGISAELASRVPWNGAVLGAVVELIDRGDRTGAALRERLEAAWEDRAFAARYERPLLLLAALRFEALGAGPGHPLWAALAAERPDPAAARPGPVAEALADPAVGRSLATRFVQTNEPSRAVAWRWPAALAGADRGARPIALVDLGCSAGLNLVADALPAPWRDEDGRPVPAASEIDAALRLGLDRRPLDVADPDTRRWLEACLWAGETERLERFHRAVAAFRAARDRPHPPRLHAVPALDMPVRLAEVRAMLPPETPILAYQTVLRDYLAPDERRRYEAELAAWLAGEPPGLAAWIELEGAASRDASWPAAIVAHVAAPDGPRSFALARCGWHPTTLRIDRDAEARLAGALGGR